MNPDEIIKNYAEGDDVPMAVSVSDFIGAAGNRIRIGLLLIDYSSATSQKIRDVYTSLIEDLFNGKDFDHGLDLVNKGSEVYVASRVNFQVAFLGHADEHYANGPTYFATMPSSPEFVEAFFREANRMGTWVLHLKTTKHSYLFMVDTLTGMVKSRVKRDPMELEFVNNLPPQT